MSEDRLQLVSLSVLGGPLHGRRYNPEEVVGEVLIGSDSSCHLVLDLPTISPIHAKVWTDLGDSKLLDTSAPRGVYLNNERVEGQARLDEGDVFWLGAPQEAGSVCIKCHFKPWVEVLPSAPVGRVEPTADLEAPPAVDPALDAAGFEEADAEEPSPMLDVEAAGVDERLEPPPAEAAPEGSVPEESGLGDFPTDSHVAEESAAAPAEATPSEPEATESEPAAAAAAPGEDDPFFVGEAAASAPPAAPAHVAEPVSHEEPSHAVAEVDFGTAPQEPPTEHVPVAMSDDWSISETQAEAERAPGEPEPTAAPIADDFFVTEEPKPAELLEPTFIEPEPDAVPASEPVSAAPFLDLPPLEPPAVPAPVAVPPPAPSPAPRPVAAAAVPVAPAGAAFAPAGEAPPAVAAAPTPAAAAPAAQATAAPEASAAGAPKPAVRSRPQPVAARRPTGAAAPARRPGPARPAARGASGPPSWVRPAGLAGAGLLVVAALGFAAMKLFGGSVRLDSVEPKRLRVGQHATLSGAGFGSGPAAQSVLFGDREAKVLQASPSRLEVEVPETGEGRVPVVVRAQGRSSSAVEVDVFLGPRLHGISPGSAMPGEEVTLAGAGWAVGATVKFGSAAAQTLDVQPTQIRAIVPEIAGGPGTQADVVVTVAGVDSNPAPFVLGHLPAPSAPGPPSAAPGDVASAPATVAATPAPATPAPAAAATPTPSPLQLEGSWTGSQVEQGQRQYLSVSFRGNGGSVAFEGGITFTVPMLSVDKPRRDQLHFSVQIRGGLRHYSGRWDGEAVKGNVSTDEAGKNVVATFELRKR